IPDEVAIVRIDSVAGARRRRDAAARRTANVIKAIVRVREPEGVSLERHTELLVRLQLKNRACVMDVLQRNEIHVAIELMVRGKEIIERLMLAVAWVAISRGIGVFKSQARRSPYVCEGIATLQNGHICFVVQPLGVCTEAQVLEIAPLAGCFYGVI